MAKLNRKWSWAGAFFVLAFGAGATPLPWTVPAGLSPADSYQLIFVTSGTHTALSKSLGSRMHHSALIDRRNHTGASRLREISPAQHFGHPPS